MATLLDLLAGIDPEALTEGARLNVVDGEGREFVIEFGRRVPIERENPFQISI